MWELLAHQGVARLPPATPAHRLPHGRGAAGREQPYATAADVLLCARWQLPQPTPVAQVQRDTGGGGEGDVVSGGVAVEAGGGEQAGGGGGGVRKRPGEEEGREAAGGLHDAKRARHAWVDGREQPVAQASSSSTSSSSSESSSDEETLEEAEEQSDARGLLSPGTVAQQQAQSVAPGAAPLGPRAGELATRDHVARTAEERVRLLHAVKSFLLRRGAHGHAPCQSDMELFCWRPVQL